MLRPVNATAQVLATALIGVAAVSVILQLRRARGVERQQLKWLAYAAVVLAGCCYLFAFLYTQGTVRSVPPLVDTVVSGLSLVVVPAAIGMAVLRYRLYDIDRIINRSLVYGLLTALPGAVYAGVVLVLGQLSGGLGTTPPSWAVDRRFNLRRYNLAKTIEAFSIRLRDQIDLDTLSAELMAVVDQSMEPTRVSLWLRPSPDGSSGTTHGVTTRMGLWLRTNSGGRWSAHRSEEEPDRGAVQGPELRRRQGSASL